VVSAAVNSVVCVWMCVFSLWSAWSQAKFVECKQFCISKAALNCVFNLKRKIHKYQSWSKQTEMKSTRCGGQGRLVGPLMLKL